MGKVPMFNCHRCPYSSKLRSAIIRHLEQTHGQFIYVKNAKSANESKKSSPTDKKMDCPESQPVYTGKGDRGNSKVIGNKMNSVNEENSIKNTYAAAGKKKKQSNSKMKLLWKFPNISRKISDIEPEKSINISTESTFQDISIKDPLSKLSTLDDASNSLFVISEVFGNAPFDYGNDQTIHSTAVNSDNSSPVYSANLTAVDSANSTSVNSAYSQTVNSANLTTVDSTESQTAPFESNDIVKNVLISHQDSVIKSWLRNSLYKETINASSKTVNKTFGQNDATAADIIADKFCLADKIKKSKNNKNSKTRPQNSEMLSIQHKRMEPNPLSTIINGKSSIAGTNLNSRCSTISDPSMVITENTPPKSSETPSIDSTLKNSHSNITVANKDSLTLNTKEKVRISSSPMDTKNVNGQLEYPKNSREITPTILNTSATPIINDQQLNVHKGRTKRTCVQNAEKNRLFLKIAEDQKKSNKKRKGTKFTHKKTKKQKNDRLDDKQISGSYLPQYNTISSLEKNISDSKKMRNFNCVSKNRVINSFIGSNPAKIIPNPFSQSNRSTVRNFLKTSGGPPETSNMKAAPQTRTIDQMNHGECQNKRTDTNLNKIEIIIDLDSDTDDINPCKSLNNMKSQSTNTIQTQPTTVSSNEPNNASNNHPTNALNKQPTNASNNQPTNVSNKQPTNASNNQPSNVSNKQPTNASNNQPTNVSNKQPTNASNNQPTNVSNKQPTNVSNNQPTNVSNKQSINVSNNQPTNVSNQQSTNGSNIQPVNYNDHQQNTSNESNKEIDMVTGASDSRKESRENNDKDLNQRVKLESIKSSDVDIIGGCYINKEDELFLKAMMPIISKLSSKNKAEVKFKIFQIIHEAEMKEL